MFRAIMVEQFPGVAAYEYRNMNYFFSGCATDAWSTVRLLYVHVSKKKSSTSHGRISFILKNAAAEKPKLIEKRIKKRKKRDRQKTKRTVFSLFKKTEFSQIIYSTHLF